jgi:hypothetical protein
MVMADRYCKFEDNEIDQEPVTFNEVSRRRQVGCWDVQLEGLKMDI